MNLQFLNWKISLDNPSEVASEDFFKAFSGWIPESPEIFVDVADYRHVHNGPVIILVGHYLNYSLDGTDGRLGLLYDYKQPMEDGNEKKLRSTLLGLLRAAKRLEDDPIFNHKPRFRAWELNLSVNSRALAPNTSETLEFVKPDLAAVFADVYAGGRYTLEHLRDPRRRFSVQVRAEGTPGLTEVLRRLE
jgi:hypothetical protein